jgi:hypothetical protein
MRKRENTQAPKMEAAITLEMKRSLKSTSSHLKRNQRDSTLPARKKMQAKKATQGVPL